MQIGLMIEGQNDLTWERWTHVLALAERLHFPTVFRSDHYFIGRQQNSLDAFLSFVMAARQTSTIRFGPLVTPVTFRSPVDVGRMAAQLHVLSGGRFTLGVGAGWNEPEHRQYGIPFPPPGERVSRLEEAIRVMQALWSAGPSSYAGKYYSVTDVDCLPKPAGHLPLIIGGSGEQRTLRLVARYADEWNCVNQPRDAYQHKLQVLEQHCQAVGRDPGAIKRSMMMFAFAGPTEAAVDDLLRRFFNEPSATSTALRARATDRHMLTGTTQQVVDTLGDLAALGLHEVELQHFFYDDDAYPEYLASELAPRLR